MSDHHASGSAAPPAPFQQQHRPPHFMQNQLPMGWTEHKAPAGQLYWYNIHSKVSTYTRPAAPFPHPPPPPPPGFTPFGHLPPPPAGFSSSSSSSVAPPLAQLAPLHFGLTGANSPLLQPAPAIKEKKEKKEKPLTKTPIEGSEWTRVVTTKGNTFYTNRETKESVWTVPGEIRDLVEELERSERPAEEVKEEEGEAVMTASAVEIGKALKRKVDDEEEGRNDANDSTAAVVIKKEVDGEDADLDAGKTVTEPPTKKKRGYKSKLVSSVADMGEQERNELMEAMTATIVKAESMELLPEDIEDAEGNEAWQRELLMEIAAQDSKDTKDEVNAAPATMIARPPNAVHASLTAIPIPAMSSEEAVAVFKAMLAEKDISPMAPWDSELLKFVNDPRYLTVKTLQERRDLFDSYCKELLRASRAAKKTALEAGGGKVDPLVAYRTLLGIAVTSTRTHFSDFKRAHSKDPRFRDFGKTEGDKEKVFKAWLRELGERKRGEAKLGEERFVQMLREDGRIANGDKWSEIKTRFVSDSRYDAVPSSSLRESLFTTHLATLASSSSAGDTASSKAEKAAKAMASLREREQQVRIERERSSRNAMAARGAMGREEGERDLTSLLIDTVRDHEAHWDSTAPLIERDPRFQSNSLSMHDKRRLFESHLKTLYSKRLAVLEELFLAHSPLLTTPFTDVLPEISTSPQATRLVGSDFDKLEGLYEGWRSKRELQARRDFDQLLSESPILEHWGRLQKDAAGADVSKVLEEDEDGEGGDDAIDLRSMAKQVDLTALQAVLKHDKRFLIFDAVPEARSKWIQEYLATLAPPSLTVHQQRT